jgi:LL-diaminopimelate aminotransferase
MKSSTIRLSNLPTYFFVSLGSRLAALQAEGRDVIRLDIGSPDLPPATHIIEALIRSASDVHAHGYQPYRGTQALRSAWTEMYRRVYHVELDQETEVAPLLGTKEGIVNLSLAYVQVGDVVLVPDPGYVSYTRGAMLAGGDVYTLPLLPEKDYLPDLSQIPRDVLRKTKLMWLNYPSNPTAATSNRQFFEEAVDLAQEYNFLLCHDAVYSQILFEGEEPLSLLNIQGAKHVAVEFNSLSKSHNMAGWRSGVMIGNTQAVSALFKIKTNVDSGQFLPIQEASTVALTSDQTWLWERNQIYCQRRDAVITGLSNLGLSPRIPSASIYVWSPIPDGWNCADFSAAALEGANVSLTPGTVFGSEGEGYVRISLTAPLERTKIAMERLREWMDKI